MFSEPCAPGYWSSLGYEPCEPLPLGYYSNVGISAFDEPGECADDETTSNNGSSSAADCVARKYRYTAARYIYNIIPQQLIVWHVSIDIPLLDIFIILCLQLF